MSEAFVLISPDIAAGGIIPVRFAYRGCGGENLSPALRWYGAPAGTQSLALTVFDPDAPTGSGWWHWLVYNLPASIDGLPQRAGDPAAGLLPPGAVQGRNDYGEHAWGGPCPPPGHGPHRYVFTLHALKVPRLDLPADASAAAIGFHIHFARLAEASFTATYER